MEMRDGAKGRAKFQIVTAATANSIIDTVGED
jgi:hypothetical protein